MELNQQEVNVITKEQAEKVQLKAEDISPKYSNGSGLRVGADGNWHVVLYLPKKAPADTFPKELDGVKIETEVIGTIRLQ